MHCSKQILVPARQGRKTTIRQSQPFDDEDNFTKATQSQSLDDSRQVELFQGVYIGHSRDRVDLYFMAIAVTKWLKQIRMFAMCLHRPWSREKGLYFVVFIL